MIYILCDMNCNNFGNYFTIVGVERTLKQDKDSWIVDKNTYYPKSSCYRARLMGGMNESIIRYSRAMDYLLPEEYRRWFKKFTTGGKE